MPRAKPIREGYHLKFIPAGRMNDFIELANNFPYVDEKNIALCKFIEAYSMIVERRKESDNGFVPVQYDGLKEHLKLERGTGKLLKSLVKEGFLELDTSNYVPEVHLYEYKAKFKKLEAVLFYRNGLPTKKVDEMFQGEVMKQQNVYRNPRTKKRVRVKINKGLSEYAEVIKKVEIDREVYNYIVNNIEEIISDREYLTSHSLGPGSIKITDLIKRLEECHSLMPKIFTYEIIGEIPSEIIPVLKIVGKKFRVTRPNPKSRIYTNITNLSRKFRPYLRVNGRPLHGFDIGNSQPLIASILFRGWSKKEYGFVKDDVLEYQQQCENKLFYEYFMKKFGIRTDCENARAEFKKQFFGKVFYTMETDKENELKTAFKEKYPTCYDALFWLKGGLFSREYKKFPVMMQEQEASIMVDANLELINKGYDVVNIFDSLLSDNKEAIEKAKEIVLSKFGEYEVTPTLVPVDYRRKLDCNKVKVNLRDEKGEYTT